MRRPGAARALAACIAAGLLVLACGSDEAAAPASGAGSGEIGDHECAACGMLVRDQPAPRGRALHRDGTEVFACSIGDLLVHMASPSPHGRVTRAWVEVLAPEADPAERDLGRHAWVDADDAWYVVGVERRGIMGAPVLAYADEAQAAARARQHPGALAVDREGLAAWWEALQR